MENMRNFIKPLHACHLKGVHFSEPVVTAKACELPPRLLARRGSSPGACSGLTAGFTRLLAEGAGAGAILSQGARTGRRDTDTGYRMLKSGFVLKDEKGRD